MQQAKNGRHASQHLTAVFVSACSQAAASEHTVACIAHNQLHCVKWQQMVYTSRTCYLIYCYKGAREWDVVSVHVLLHGCSSFCRVNLGCMHDMLLLYDVMFIFFMSLHHKLTVSASCRGCVHSALQRNSNCASKLVSTLCICRQATCHH